MTNDRIKKAPYVRMYCGTWLDNKVAGITLEAETVYYRAIQWSKGEDLDGLVPWSVLPMLCQKCLTAPDKIAAELLAVGLWVERNSAVGVDPERFAEYQIPAERAVELRAQARERKARSRAKANGDTP